VENDTRFSRKYQCESREKGKMRYIVKLVSLAICESRNLSARLARIESCFEISVCETCEERVSLLILTFEPRKNLARILGLKSESRFSRECQKVILMSTLL
jgi:hypothetical protein